MAEEPAALPTVAEGKDDLFVGRHAAKASRSSLSAKASRSFMRVCVWGVCVCVASVSACLRMRHTHVMMTCTNAPCSQSAADVGNLEGRELSLLDELMQGEVTVE